MNIFWRRFASKPFKIKIVLSTLFGQLLILLDVMGVVFAASLASLLFSEFQGGALPEPTLRLIAFVGINQWTFDSQFIAIGSLTVIFLILKSVLSTLMIFLNFSLLAKEAVRVENELTKYVFEVRDYLKNREDNFHRLIYGLTSGVENLIVVRFGSQINLLTDIATVMALISVLLSRELLIGGVLISILLITFTILEETVNNKSRNYGEILYKGLTSVSQKIHEGLMMQREFKVWNMNNPKIAEAYPIRRQLATIKGRSIVLPNVGKYIIEIMVTILMVTISSFSLLYGGAREAIEGIVLLFLVTSRIIPALLRIQNSRVSIKNVEGSSSLTIELLNELSESSGYEVEVTSKASELRVRNISFRYPNAKRDVIKNFSFSFYPGEFIGVVGKTGSGKSTLIAILLGLLRSQQGEVQITQNYSGRTDGTYRLTKSYVPQDPFVFSGTLRENVLCGRQFSDLEVSLALEVAEFNIRGLSKVDILDYELELSGTNLSGGEKQRLAIARGIIGKPSFLFLDEATSALDVETETKIMRNLELYLPPEAIKLLVTHRIGTLKRADRLIVLTSRRIATYNSYLAMKAALTKNQRSKSK